MPRPPTTWKGIEAKVAKMFGTFRTPLSGINSRHTGSDTLHKKLYIEVKHRTKFAVLSLFKDTAEKAWKEDKQPLVVIHEKQGRDCFAILPLDRKYIRALLEAMEESDE